MRAKLRDKLETNFARCRERSLALIPYKILTMIHHIDYILTDAEDESVK